MGVLKRFCFGEQVLELLPVRAWVEGTAVRPREERFVTGSVRGSYSSWSWDDRACSACGSGSPPSTARTGEPLKLPLRVEQLGFEVDVGPSQPQGFPLSHMKVGRLTAASRKAFACSVVNGFASGSSTVGRSTRVATFSPMIRRRWAIFKARRGAGHPPPAGRRRGPDRRPDPLVGRTAGLPDVVACSCVRAATSPGSRTIPTTCRTYRPTGREWSSSGRPDAADRSGQDS